MASLAKLRMAQQRNADAESLLRDVLSTRDDEGPCSWQPSERLRLLGLNLMEQAKFADAEPPLISGHQGLLQRKSVIPPTVSFQHAGEGIVQLYAGWGRPDQAAEWRKKLQAREYAAAGRK